MSTVLIQEEISGEKQIKKFKMYSIRMVTVYIQWDSEYLTFKYRTPKHLASKDWKHLKPGFSASSFQLALTYDNMSSIQMLFKN